jgi:hypothetical protein
MEGAVVLTLTAVSVCVGGALGYFAWERCDVPGARSYTVHVPVHALWGLSYGLELVSESAATMALANAFVTVWSTTAAVSWLVFVLDYTERAAWLKPRRLALLLAKPIAYIALYVTNSRHGLVYSGSTVERTAGLSYVSIEGTALLYGQILIIYLILSIGFALLGAFILRSRNLYRKQTTTIFLGALVFGIGNLVWVATVGEGYGLDLTHLFFIGNGVVIGWALFRHEFLDGAPLASDVLIEEMDDPVVVVDDDDQRLIDYNEAAEAAFDLEASPHGARVGGRLAEVVEASEGPVRVGDGPAATDGGAATVYQPKRTRLSDQHDIVRGELLVYETSPPSSGGKPNSKRSRKGRTNSWPRKAKPTSRRRRPATRGQCWATRSQARCCTTRTAKNSCRRVSRPRPSWHSTTRRCGSSFATVGGNCRRSRRSSGSHAAVLQLLFFGEVGVGVAFHARSDVLADVGERIGVVPVVDRLDDRFAHHAGVLCAEDAGPDEDAVTAVVHHQGGVGRRRDAPGREVDDR